MRKTEDIAGSRFGRLVVDRYYGLVPNGKQKQSAWVCKCDCGIELVVPSRKLKQGKTCCGCNKSQKASLAQLHDLTGQKFGLLTVLSYEETRNKNAYWLCKCDCGKQTTVSACSLKSGGCKSCGCKQGWHRSEKPGLWKNRAAYAQWQRQNPVKKLRNAVSNSIRGMIKHNGSYKRKQSIRNYLPYTIDELKSHLESLWEPWMNWTNYGGRSNDPRRTWHIDHVKPHSSFNYTSMADAAFSECWALSNLRPIEKIANMSKGAKILTD
jgi:hypothetical protein